MKQAMHIMMLDDELLRLVLRSARVRTLDELARTCKRLRDLSLDPRSLVPRARPGGRRNIEHMAHPDATTVYRLHLSRHFLCGANCNEDQAHMAVPNEWNDPRMISIKRPGARAGERSFAAE